jgi:hemoglobin
MADTPDPQPMSDPTGGAPAATPRPVQVPEPVMMPVPTTGAPAPSMYERVGGMPFFEALVDRFYEGVANDPLLLPMYPAEELDGARRRLTLFLAQYWGGPATYSEQRGHPRLRMRHARFAIDPAARDAWLTHMGRAVANAGLEPAEAAELLGYFHAAADHLQNQP